MEAIGLIASIIQIADAAQQLRTFCSDLRSAPKDILDLVEEVSLAADLITDIKDQQHLANITGANPRSWTRCLSLFQACAESMTSLATDLHSTLKLHRRTGSLRVFLKVLEVQRCRERLQRVLSMMLSAQQAYAILFASVNSAMIVQELQNLSNQQGRIIASLDARGVSADTGQDMKARVVHNKNMDLTCGYLDTHSIHIARKPERRKTFELGLPFWILRKACQFLFEQSNSSWGLTVRFYNRLGPDAKVFAAASRGKWDEVQRMFATGQATPYDVDIWDRTLLNVAAVRADPEACIMLMEHGLDPGRRSNWFYSTPAAGLCNILQVSRPQMTEEISTRLVRIFRLFADSVPEAFYRPDSKFSRYLLRMPPSAVSTVRHLILPAYEQLDPAVRVSMALTECTNIDSVSVLLGSSLTLQQAFAIAQETHTPNDHMSLLHGMAFELASMGRDESLVRRHLLTLREIVKFEAVNTTTHKFRSPLRKFVESYFIANRRAKARAGCSSENELFTKVGRIWLGHLVSAGADLNKYGRAERRYQCNEDLEASHNNHKFPVYLSRERSFAFRIVGLTTGPEITDWSLFVVPMAKQITRFFRTLLVVEDHTFGHDEYEMAGAFWNWAENLELFNIPGTYIEVEDDFKAQSRRSLSVCIKGPIL